MDPLSAIEQSVTELGLVSLKEKQREAILTFIQGRDTFVSLPTGYGKSVIYAILPFVFDKIRGEISFIFFNHFTLFTKNLRADYIGIIMSITIIANYYYCFITRCLWEYCGLH